MLLLLTFPAKKMVPQNKKVMLVIEEDSVTGGGRGGRGNGDRVFYLKDI